MKRTFYVMLVLLWPLTLPAQDEGESPGQLTDVDVNFMLRGYCYAGSNIVDSQALGGFGQSKNFPRPIDGAIDAPRGRLSLIARPEEPATFAGRYNGMKLLLINKTGAGMWFRAADSRLPIVQEALDENGEWRAIEYLPQSWCGNSYHRVFLGDGEYWSFTTPRYVGSYKTKLRFRFERGNEAPIFSNEFDGSINPEQFTIKQGHTPTSIMDPYID